VKLRSQTNPRLNPIQNHPPRRQAAGNHLAPGDRWAMPNTQDADNEESNKPNPVTQELLEKLGKPTQPTGCAAGAAGSVTDAWGCEN